jgi:hypothetical protein
MSRTTRRVAHAAAHRPAPAASTLLHRAIEGLICVTVCAGCSFAARDANAYRDATRALLETKNDTIKGCYDEALKKNATVAGNVVVTFKVQPKTGQLSKVKIDKAQTTAPKSLARCVTHALEGLTLQPPDAREGNASFRWEFQVQG